VIGFSGGVAAGKTISKSVSQRAALLSSLSGGMPQLQR